MPIDQASIDAIQGMHLTAQRSSHRCVVLFCGSQRWCLEAATFTLATLQPQSVHWFSDRAPPEAEASQGAAALRLLGTELDALVFDAWSGFDPDAFGALSGTLRAGGVLLLLTPPLSEWPEYSDPQNARITVESYPADMLTARYIQRLARVLDTNTDIMRFEEGLPVVRATTGSDVQAVTGESVAPPYRSRDQKLAVEAVVRVVTGHRRRPVVLTADRGRGKSAAFGIAAAELIEKGRGRILVTGPGEQAVQAVIDHARALLPEHKYSAIHFVPADVLVREPESADVLLVDEAAAIPAPLLLALLKRYSRIAFATTVHGYEGTGRGFALRFNNMLDQYTNSWKSVRLETPIRWAPGDPLERLCFRMLLLDADPAPEEVVRMTDRASWTIERLNRDSLVRDEAMLGELFGLLVQAHYRTRPLDLRYLLDGPNLSVYVMRGGGHIAATALIAEEGGLSAAVADAICSGRRRPRGHLIPETLAVHQGLCEALRLTGDRIARIAVHPAVQRQGLGRQLLQHIVAEARQAGRDYIGSSFGATQGLLQFWRKSGSLPIRVGFQRGAASGFHSVVVLNPLSTAGETLAADARERYFANLPHQLADSLRDLDAELVQELLRSAGGHAVKPSAADWRDLQGFAGGQRLLENCVGAAWRLTCYALMEGGGLPLLERQEISMLIARVLQKQSWQQCAHLLGLSGRTEALAVLRSAVQRLIGYYQAPGDKPAPQRNSGNE